MSYKEKFSGNTDKTLSLGKDGVNAIEGYFLGTKETPDTMGYGPGKLHVFKTEEGNVGVWGKSRLNTLLTSDLVGQMVLVEFTGMVQPTKKGKKPSYGFKVQHDPDNTIEVSSDALSQPESADDYEDADAEEAAPAAQPAARMAYKTPTAADRSKVNALLSGRKVG